MTQEGEGRHVCARTHARTHAHTHTHTHTHTHNDARKRRSSVVNFPVLSGETKKCATLCGARISNNHSSASRKSQANTINADFMIVQSLPEGLICNNQCQHTAPLWDCHSAQKRVCCAHRDGSPRRRGKQVTHAPFLCQLPQHCQVSLAVMKSGAVCQTQVTFPNHPVLLQSTAT